MLRFFSARLSAVRRAAVTGAMVMALATVGAIPVMAALDGPAAIGAAANATAASAQPQALGWG